MKMIKTLAAAAAGVAYGMLFAQKSGKKLRSDLSKSKDPLNHLFEELKKMGKESGDAATAWAKDSEELQEVLKSGKKQFDALVKGAKDLGEEQAEMMKDGLDDLIKNAEKAKKDIEKKGAKFKNEVEKEVKTVANKLKK